MESGQSVGHTRGGQSLYWQFLGPTTKVCFLKIFSKLFFNFYFSYDDNRRLFEAEEQDLFADLQSLPRTAALRY